MSAQNLQLFFMIFGRVRSPAPTVFAIDYIKRTPQSATPTAPLDKGAKIQLRKTLPPLFKGGGKLKV